MTGGRERRRPAPSGAGGPGGATWGRRGGARPPTGASARRTPSGPRPHRPGPVRARRRSGWPTARPPRRAPARPAPWPAPRPAGPRTRRVAAPRARRPPAGGAARARPAAPAAPAGIGARARRSAWGLGRRRRWRRRWVGGLAGRAPVGPLGAFQFGVTAQPELQRGRLGVQVEGLLDPVLLVQVAEQRLGAVDDLVVGVGEHGGPLRSNVCSSVTAAPTGPPGPIPTTLVVLTTNIFGSRVAACWMWR